MQSFPREVPSWSLYERRSTLAVKDLLEGSRLEVLLGFCWSDLDEAGVLLLDGWKDLGNIGCVHHIITMEEGKDSREKIHKGITFYCSI